MRLRLLAGFAFACALVACAAVLGLPDPELDVGIGSSSSGGVDSGDATVLGDGGAAFGLKVASEITLRLGKSAPLEVVLDRPSAASGTSLSLSGLAMGVTAPDVVVPAGETKGTLVISAAPNASAASTKATLIAREGTAVIGGADVLVTVLPDGSGVPDPTFGDGGIITTNTTFSPALVAYGADAKLVVVGADLNANRARRYLPDGSLDTTYGANGLATLDTIPNGSTLQALTVMPNGKAIVGYKNNGGSGGLFVVMITADGVLVPPPRPVPFPNATQHDVKEILFDAPSNLVFVTVSNSDINFGAYGASVAKYDELLAPLAFAGNPFLNLSLPGITGIPMGIARPAPLPSSKLFVVIGKTTNPDIVKVMQFDAVTGDPTPLPQMIPFGAASIDFQMSSTDGGAFITGGVLVDGGGVQVGATRVGLTTVDPAFGGTGGARASLDGGLLGVRLVETNGGVVVAGCAAPQQFTTLVRFNGAGVLDTAFGDGGFTAPIANKCFGALHRDAQGRVLAAASDGSTGLFLVRYVP